MKKYKIPWLTMASVLGIVLQYVLSRFGIELDSPVLNALITMVCGGLAVAGVVAPIEKNTEGDEQEEKNDEQTKDE